MCDEYIDTSNNTIDNAIIQIHHNMFLTLYNIDAFEKTKYCTVRKNESNEMSNWE